MDEEFRKLVTMFERAGDKTGYLKMFSEEELQELSLNAAVGVWQRKGYKVLRLEKPVKWQGWEVACEKEFPELKILEADLLDDLLVYNYAEAGKEIAVFENDADHLYSNDYVEKEDDEKEEEKDPQNNIVSTLFVDPHGKVVWALTESLPPEEVKKIKEKQAKTAAAKKKKDLAKLKEKQAKLEKELAKLTATQEKLIK